MLAAARKAGACLLSLVLVCGLMPVAGYADDALVEDAGATSQGFHEVAERGQTTGSESGGAAVAEPTEGSESDSGETAVTPALAEAQEAVSVSAAFSSIVEVVDDVALVQGAREAAFLTLTVEAENFDPTNSVMIASGSASEKNVSLSWTKEDQGGNTWKAKVALADVILAGEAQGVSLALRISTAVTSGDAAETLDQTLSLSAVTVGAPSTATETTTESASSQIRTIALGSSATTCNAPSASFAQAQTLPAFTRIAFAADVAQGNALSLSSASSNDALDAYINIASGFPEVDGVTYYPAAYNVPLELHVRGDAVVKRVFVNDEELVNVVWQKNGDGWMGQLYLDTAYQETQVKLVVQDASGNEKVALSPKFVMDISAPVISFGYERLSSSVVVTVRDAYLDIANTTVNGCSVPVENWSVVQEENGIKAWSTLVPCPEGTSDFTTLVSAVDLSGRSANDKRTFDRAEIASWELDITPPKVAIDAIGSYLGTRDGIDYFSDISKIVARIEDDNLSSWEVVINSSGWVERYFHWVGVDDESEIVSELGDLMMGEPSTVTYIVTDRAGNTTTYSYGQLSSDGCSTADSSGRVLSGDRFCVIGDEDPSVTAASISFDAFASDGAQHFLRGTTDFFSGTLCAQICIDNALAVDWNASCIQVQGESCSLKGLADKSKIDHLKTPAYIALCLANEGDESFSLTLKPLFGDAKTYSYAELVSSGLVSFGDSALLGSSLVLDTVAPNIDITFADGDVVEGACYSSPQTAIVTVEEVNFDPALFDIRSSGTLGSWRETERGVYALAVTFGEGQGHYLTVSGADKAGNVADEAASNRFNVDLTSPDISVVYNETNESGFYNAARTATVTVHEVNFDAGMMSTETSGQAGAWSQVGTDMYRMTVTFDEGQNHYLNVSGKDLAGNAANPYRADVFTVDLTNPVMSISFDNNAAQNGSYYNNSRTATLRVDEVNFNPSLIAIQTTGSIGSWWTEGSSHYVRVSFTSDGNHAIAVSGKDLAGNAASPLAEQTFVIDTQAPTIDIQSVEDGQAYSQSVAPLLALADEANFNASSVSWTLTGSRYGDRSSLVSVASSVSSAGQTISFQDFAALRELDDIYTLTAQVSDMAGNTTQKTITFSVNRFGSTYEIIPSDGWVATAATDGSGYCDLQWVGTGEPTAAPAVTIREINVVGCRSESQSVTVLRDGEALMTSTKDETGATVWEKASANIAPVESSSAGWSVYDYVVPASLFAESGEYTIYVSSVDNTNNARSSAYYFSDDGTSTSQVVRLEWNASSQGDSAGVLASAGSSLLPFAGAVVVVLALSVLGIALYFRKRDEELARLYAEALGRSGDE